MENGKTGRTNPERIFSLLRTETELTKQEIAAQLHLSMPTALQNINRMLEAGFLEECGETASTGGRRGHAGRRAVQRPSVCTGLIQGREKR